MKGKNISTITPSDWINFLQGERNFSLSFMFPIFTAMIIIYIALIQINLDFGSELFPLAIEDITIGLFFLIFFIILLIGLDVKPISKLSHKIMKGKLLTHEEILVEYRKNVENRWWKPWRKSYRRNSQYKKVEKMKKVKDSTNWEDSPAFVKNKR